MADIEILVPRKGWSVQEVTVTEWLVADQGEVRAGEPVVSVETDKVETELEAPAAGVLHHGAQPGDTLGVGQALGLIVTP